MIYAQLHVFSGYSAYVTAEDEEDFLDTFKAIVHNAVSQYEDTFGKIATEHKTRIQSEMQSFVLDAGQSLDDLVYDTKIDGAGYRGIVEVAEIFPTLDAVMERFQPFVDELNIDFDGVADDTWTVMGDFFPASLGYEIDELFK
jgi:hypothetical protein